MNDEKKQELYVELQLLDQKIKKAQKHAEKLDEQMTELVSVQAAVNDFAKLSAGAEMKVPLANGIYFPAELKDTQELFVNVGANVLVSKTIPEVQKLLDTQMEELTEYRAKVMASFQKMVARVEKIQGEFKEKE